MPYDLTNPTAPLSRGQYTVTCGASTVWVVRVLTVLLPYTLGALSKGQSFVLSSQRVMLTWYTIEPTYRRGSDDLSAESAA